MLRAFFIALSKLNWAQRVITKSKLASRMALRFVAGEQIDAAVAVIQNLNQKGILATVDHLGEDTFSISDAELAVEEIINTLEVIQQKGLRSNVSLKLSQIGLNIQQELCKENLKRILQKAQEINNFVRIDMEDSSLTDSTLEVFRWVRMEGYTNVGIVLQAYLYRTEEDIKILGKSNATFRLCKGAYQEPASVAFPQKAEVDKNYDALIYLLFTQIQDANFPQLSSDGRFPGIPALATHDEKRIATATNLMQSMNIPKACVEFQMLYGIRRELQKSLCDEGYTVRVYVPYGTHWYRYFMRRLAERPANLWFMLTNLFKK
jgi:proline dehydrogenase